MIGMSDWIGWTASFGYALGLLALAELLHRRAGVAAGLTRKLVHVGAGMWTLAVPLLFTRWETGIVPFASFIVINAVLYRTRLARSLDDRDASPGTIYFAAVITALFAWCWRPGSADDRVVLAIAALMTLTWGDAWAALIGRRYGRHRYQIFGATRSVEGSVTMAAVSVVAIGLSLAMIPGSAIAPAAPAWDSATIVAAALAGALAATAAEAVAPHGSDNLSVPLATLGVLWAMLG
jgi:phytol kinase